MSSFLSYDKLGYFIKKVKGEIPTVSDTYSESSTDAMSGIAVAEAIKDCDISNINCGNIDTTVIEPTTEKNGMKRLQILHGTTVENNAFVGRIGELTVNTDDNSLRVHDGETAGGHEVGFDTSKLATVATSGSYNDLTDKPTIPSTDGFLPITGGTMAGDITGAGATFTSLSVGGDTAEAVAEYGGDYIRYSSGVQVCWAVLSENNWSYPKPFLYTPAVVATCHSVYSGSYYAAISSSNTSSVELSVSDTEGGSVAGVTISLIACGIWKEDELL